MGMPKGDTTAEPTNVTIYVYIHIHTNINMHIQMFS